MEGAASGAATLQLLVSLPWGDRNGGAGRTRVLPVPVPVGDASSEGGTTMTTTTTAGALLAPLLRAAEAEAGGRGLPPLVATYHGKRYVPPQRG